MIFYHAVVFFSKFKTFVPLFFFQEQYDPHFERFGFPNLFSKKRNAVRAKIILENCFEGA